jgi:hypothetical protein
MKTMLLFCMVVLAGHTGVLATGVDTSFITPFERSKGAETATYLEANEFYKRLFNTYHNIFVGDAGMTDIGLPLRVIYADKRRRNGPDRCAG